MEVVWLNLNFTELSTILQLFTIQNSFGGNNFKPQAIKGYLNKQKFIFL